MFTVNGVLHHVTVNIHTYLSLRKEFSKIIKCIIYKFKPITTPNSNSGYR